MGFNFPNSPALNDTYSPVGGPVFTWDGVAWKGTSQGAPVTVYVSDTAPLSPAIGQLWWNSATGTMAIWYADADSAQWVQVSGQVLPTAPSDNGEYVMVNGVWRLVRQSFSWAGLTQIDVPVPAWGPSEARIATFAYQSTTAAVALNMRLSIDGTTFPAGASDYTFGGFFHSNSGAATSNNPTTAASFWGVTSNGDNLNVPLRADVHVTLNRSAGGFASYRVLSSCFSTTLFLHINYSGYLGGASWPGTGPIKTIRMYGSAVAFASGRLTVDWLQ